MKIENLSWDDLTASERASVPDNGCGMESANYLRVSHGEMISLYSDAMEPEDAVFYRDLSWISGAIERAFKSGYLDGAEDAGRRYE